ncbi:uncharacterized protein LOC122068642 [Macadamia integrifolia]|uniref:uncharacterized protein LOC122068642 n=1 Tax=Macadamia integrifolia TaxID=60698 RepID=UPI001C4F6569|nr:uncharacterized protein LOC122068642 [Macadamia integrifolia]
MKGSGASSSTSADSILNPCPICLGPVKQEAYLDGCFHKFCFNCIAEWAKLLTSRHPQLQSFVTCPICKGDNFSIIYGFDGNSFQQHYPNQDVEKSFSLSEVHKYRLRCYYSEPGAIYEKFNVLKYWKSNKYLQPNKWLQTWLRREFQALTKVEDVEILVHHILGVVESFMKRNKRELSKITPEQKREEFKALVSDAAKRFLMENTECFVNEVELFLAAGLTIEAYDEVYLQSLDLGTFDTSEETDVHEQTHDLFYEDFDSNE